MDENENRSVQFANELNISLSIAPLSSVMRSFYSLTLFYRFHYRASLIPCIFLIVYKRGACAMDEKQIIINFKWLSIALL